MYFVKIKTSASLTNQVSVRVRVCWCCAWARPLERRRQRHEKLDIDVQKMEKLFGVNCSRVIFAFVFYYYSSYFYLFLRKIKKLNISILLMVSKKKKKNMCVKVMTKSCIQFYSIVRSSYFRDRSMRALGIPSSSTIVCCTLRT
jgi:hypothetical protein